MADDGSFKGHGGTGRRSTVVSMSAHKNRHLQQNTDAPSRKLPGLTLFDFAPSDPELDEISDVSSSSEEGLPCETSPFERNETMSETPTRMPARRFLRWGLEDGHAEAEAESGLDDELLEDDLEDEILSKGKRHQSEDFIDDESQDVEASLRARALRRKWHHKTGRSGSVEESFYHAFRGLEVGFSTQRNVRIHCGISVTVVALALLLKVDTTGCLALVLATGFVLFAEYVNTALEHVTDIQAGYRYHRSARYAKDTAAAAVLIAATTAVLVGIIVLAPRILILLSGKQL